MQTRMEMIKLLISKTFPPRLQRQLRKRYLIRQILRGQAPPELEAALLPALIAPGDSVADIGANAGFFTRQLSLLVGPQGRVYSFEPISENFQILQAMVRRGRLQNVSLFHAALGSGPGRCEMVVPDSPGFAGLYLARFVRPGDAGRREKVKVLTLDCLRKEGVVPRLDFIKCDVEGSELALLRGAVGVLLSQRPSWLLEVDRSTAGDVMSTLADAGYHCFVYNGDLEETTTYLDGRFSNYLFVHPESKLWDRLPRHGSPHSAAPR